MAKTTKDAIPKGITKNPLPSQVKDTVHKNGNPGGTLGRLKAAAGTNHKVGDTNQSKKKG